MSGCPVPCILIYDCIRWQFLLNKEIRILVVNTVGQPYFFQVSVRDHFVDCYGYQAPVYIGSLILNPVSFSFTEDT
jgi:hypothetical protein